MDLRSRYKRCVVAMEATVGKSAANMVCAQSVYGSRGYNIRKTTRNRRTVSRRQTRSAGDRERSHK